MPIAILITMTTQQPTSGKDAHMNWMQYVENDWAMTDEEMEESQEMLNEEEGE